MFLQQAHPFLPEGVIVASTAATDGVLQDQSSSTLHQ